MRDVFKSAFEGAGLPYFNPHSFRSMIIRHAMTLDLSPEEMKALSQNLGHSDVLTTFTSYGAGNPPRTDITGLGGPDHMPILDFARWVVRECREVCADQILSRL